MSIATQPELQFDELRPPLAPAEAVVEAMLVAEIQARIDADWEDLLRRCQGGDLP